MTKYRQQEPHCDLPGVVIMGAAGGARPCLWSVITVAQKSQLCPSIEPWPRLTVDIRYSLMWGGSGNNLVSLEPPGALIGLVGFVLSDSIVYSENKWHSGVITVGRMTICV